MFINESGEEIKDEQLQKLAGVLTEYTDKFTKDCQEAAEKNGCKLTVVVKFAPEKILEGE